jgi:ribosomal protein S18 acetylase RimI-like enzyme
VEPDRALAAFDAEVRRSVRPDGSGARIEADPLVVRWVGADGRGWSGIAWSGLGDADADAVIAAQVAYFAARDEKFEWKLYNYDRPPDLGGRLLAAGFAADGEESLMVTEVSSAPTQADLPPGIRLLPVTDEAGVGLLADVHERVFGTDSSRLRRSVLAQLQDRPEAVAMVVAMAGDQPVCSARIEFHPGSSFASLWGGGTLPGWRGQGIYRALIAYRARQGCGGNDHRAGHTPARRQVQRRTGHLGQLGRRQASRRHTAGVEAAGLGAIVQRDRDRDSQRRGLHDDEQPD